MASVVVNPEPGNRIVVPDDKVASYLARGFVADEDYHAQAEARAEAEYQAWLNDPATEADRFAMLREERDQRISRTDYLIQADYPLDPALRQKVITFRQALRDLPAQPGAPWDGGGEKTPWPESPLG